MQISLYPQYHPASTQTPPTASPQSTWKDWNFPPVAIATSQKKVIFHAVVECRISANKMQVHRIPDVGAYFLFIFCLFAVHTPTPCIWVCLKMVYTLQMVIEFGDILSNNTWKWYPICGQTHTPTKYDLAQFIIFYHYPWPVYHTILYSGKYDILYIVSNSG